MKFKLTRYLPQKIEIDVLPSQITSMFPIEVQSHPVFGQLKRVWKADEVEYSVESFRKEEIDVVKQDKHEKVKDEVMLKILQDLDRFQIILYYSDKEDIYDVVKI